MHIGTEIYERRTVKQGGGYSEPTLHGVAFLGGTVIASIGFSPRELSPENLEQMHQEVRQSAITALQRTLEKEAQR